MKSAGNLFEIVVEDMFTITGRGTIFAGEIRSGSISIGDPVLCKARSNEVQTRVIALEEIGTKRSLKSAESGTRVAVVCKAIDHSDLPDAYEGEGEDRRFVGATLTLGSKKSWWQF